MPEWREHWRSHALCATLLIAAILLYLAFNFSYFQPQARYLFIAIGPISIGFAIGLVYWFGKRAWMGIALTAAVLLSVNIYALLMLPAEFQKRTEGLPAQRSSMQQPAP